MTVANHLGWCPIHIWSPVVLYYLLSFLNQQQKCCEASGPEPPEFPAGFPCFPTMAFATSSDTWCWSPPGGRSWWGKFGWAMPVKTSKMIINDLSWSIGLRIFLKTLVSFQSGFRHWILAWDTWCCHQCWTTSSKKTTSRSTTSCWQHVILYIRPYHALPKVCV